MHDWTERHSWDAVLYGLWSRPTFWDFLWPLGFFKQIRFREPARFFAKPYVIRQLHQLHWILQKKSEIETVTVSQLHQLQAKKFKDVRFSAWPLGNYTNYTGFYERSQRSRPLPQVNYINYRPKNLKIFDFWLDREATTPTTLDFSKEVRDRDRYRKSTTSTTGQKI